MKELTAIEALEVMQNGGRVKFANISSTRHFRLENGHYVNFGENCTIGDTSVSLNFFMRQTFEVVRSKIYLSGRKALELLLKCQRGTVYTKHHAYTMRNHALHRTGRLQEQEQELPTDIGVNRFLATPWLYVFEGDYDEIDQ